MKTTRNAQFSIQIVLLSTPKNKGMYAKENSLSDKNKNVYSLTIWGQFTKIFSCVQNTFSCVLCAVETG